MGPKGGGEEELPHVQGQGQRPRVPGCDSAGTAEKSYPTSEVRGSCRECQAATAQEQPRELPQPEARGGGQEELSHVHMESNKLKINFFCPNRHPAKTAAMSRLLSAVLDGVSLKCPSASDR